MTLTLPVPVTGTLTMIVIGTMTMTLIVTLAGIYQIPFSKSAPSSIPP